MANNMDIITRNFFRLLRSGALNEYEALEPMSSFKWHRLDQMVHAQHVEAAALKGARNHQYDEMMNIPQDLLTKQPQSRMVIDNVRLSNRLLNHKLRKIDEQEQRKPDVNFATLDVLKIIAFTVSEMLNHGMMLNGIIILGSYLRTKGSEVDYEKLNHWLVKLHLRRMAQLMGSMLIAVFNFKQEELAFVQHIEPSAYRLVLRSVNHAASDTAEEWHFRQTNSGFVRNNSALLRRNLRRSLRYIAYAPLETMSNYFNNFARSLQEIEE